MSYYDIEPTTPEIKLGQKIYMEALADRRGFREDQLEIFDKDIWEEIFENIGQIAMRELDKHE